MKRGLKITLTLVFILLLVYSVILGGLYVTMCQDPATFSAAMSKTPGFLFPIVPFKPMWLHAREGTLKVGDQAPDFALETIDKQSTVRLSDSKGQKPVVLIFGSYTWPPFRREVPALNGLYQQYKNQAEFFLIYIQEAHASDSWRLESNDKAGIVFEDPEVYEERVNLAGTCSTDLGIEFRTLVDNIENSSEIAYTGWPDRIYVIDKAGRVAFKSDAGPFGFNTNQLANALAQINWIDQTF